MGNQSPSLLRWEQVPLQWSRDSDLEGGEGKRRQGGRREEVSERKCNRVEKTKAKFDHVPTRHRTETWPTDREHWRGEELSSAEDLCLNFNLNTVSNINIKFKEIATSYKVWELYGSPNWCRQPNTRTIFEWLHSTSHYKSWAFIRCKGNWIAHYYMNRRWIYFAFQTVYSLCQLQSFKKQFVSCSYLSLARLWGLDDFVISGELKWQMNANL